MPQKPTRQLAAIMFADLVGYTRLMQEDEAAARAQRDRHRDILSGAVTDHDGRILQYYGDGSLSIFSSAVEAVQAAVQVQLELAEQDLIPVRIGVHTGDIVYDEEGVYGDGVNVASRIESLAAAGGITVSGKVYDEIKNHPSVSAVSLGVAHLKGVEHPTAIFAITNEGLAVPSPDDISSKLSATKATLVVGPEESDTWSASPRRRAFPPEGPKRPALHAGRLLGAALVVAVAGVLVVVISPSDRVDEREALEVPRTSVAQRERPAIAVLPFTNMSVTGEADAAFLATGLHDELLTQLSKIASIDVIARTSVMQYEGTDKTVPMIGNELGVHTVLEGTLLLAGDQVRLNVQLIDADRDTHLWADMYDREFTVANVFDIQSDLARRVVLALAAELVPSEEALIAEVPTESLDAYTLYLRGKEVLERPGWGPEDLSAAVELFSEAVRLDPGFALGHAGLSMAHNFVYLMYDRSEARLSLARDAADEALRLSPELPEGHLAKAFELYHRYENEEAVGALTMAEAGLPGSVDVLTLKAELLLRQREWDASLATRERAALLDPLNPETGMNLAMAYAEMDRWGEADAVFDRILEVHPGFLEAAFTRGWYWWRRTGDEGPGRAALAGLPDDVSVFGLRTFFEWMMTEDPEEKAMALERIEEPISEFGGFWWAPRSLLEGWTYRTLDSERAGRAFARAVEDCLSGLEELPDDPRIYASLGRAQAGLGRREEAIEAAERVVELLPMDRDPVFGRDLLEFVSTIYAELGMAEEAAEAMEQVLSVPVVPPMFALLGPEFELVRDHPRFRAIIRRYPIPPER